MASFSIVVFPCLLLVTTLLLAKVTTGDLDNDYDESYKASNASSTWDYRNSSLTKTTTSMKKLNKALTHQEYVNSQIKMATWLLFGPEKSRSNLLAVRSLHLLLDDLQCVESTAQSFVKHCGVLYVDAVMHRRWFSNICRYAPNKQGIEMAFFVACIFTRVSGAYNDYDEPRKASIASTWEHRNSLRSKTPLTMKTLDHIFAAKEYVNIWIKMAAIILFGPEKAWSTLHSPQRPGSHFVDDWQCFHYTKGVCRHASLGLCQCEKDDWRPLENEMWSFVMSPYEERYVDVKFRSGIYGHVTFSLDELRDGWYFAYLSTGVALLFLASRDSKYFLPANAGYIVARFIKLVLCVNVSSELHVFFSIRSVGAGRGTFRASTRDVSSQAQTAAGLTTVLCSTSKRSVGAGQGSFRTSPRGVSSHAQTAATRATAPWSPMLGAIRHPTDWVVRVALSCPCCVVEGCLTVPKRSFVGRRREKTDVVGKCGSMRVVIGGASRISKVSLGGLGWALWSIDPAGPANADRVAATVTNRSLMVPRGHFG
ncbi:hypothetical protein CTI12_AA044450 [Artemisia annua]|uniref:Legumain prodomain domain-containing protein n=1 Tax=Artemisia annua TaxID=35608 RepID=A0A2U1QD86_ARTAN|nr:hypothetical protein CTI12_AA044450 [Artemisia annua]